MCSMVKVVTLFYTARERNSGRCMGIITLSVPFLVQIRPWSVTSFCFDIWHNVFGTWLFHHETMCCVHPRLQYDLYL